MIKYGKVIPNINVKQIVVIGGGRSLLNFNFGPLAKQDCFIITVNDVGRMVPFADAWFTVDPWGLHGPQLPGKNFKGQLYAAVPPDFGTPSAKIRSHKLVPTADIVYLQRIQQYYGLSEDPSAIFTGNSGFGAFGLAYHFRPEKILLLGIDGDVGYFYTKDKVNRSLDHLPRLFEGTLNQIRNNNITVINGSAQSTITCFPRYSPDHAMGEFFS